MNTQARKRILIHCRQAPYGNLLAREVLDIALASSVFDQDITILFSADGVWQLQPRQQAEQIDSKSIEKQLSAFPLYDIDQLYVDAHSLQQRGLQIDQLALPLKAVASEQLAAFIDSFDMVLNF